MANIKSAKKRILVNQTKAERNKAIKSSVKTAVKKVRVAIEAQDKEAAKAALLNATTVIDKAASKGVFCDTWHYWCDNNSVRRTVCFRF